MLITLLIVVVLLALALYGLSLIPLDRRLSLILQVALVAIAIIYIARVAGL